MTTPFTAKRIRVPGLLADDALQEQLKAYTEQQKTQQRAAPAPSSAFEFADRVTTDFLRSPPQPVLENARRLSESASRIVPQKSAPAGASAELRAAQDTRIENNSSFVAKALQTGLDAAVPGSGLIRQRLEQLGTLSKEDSEIATVKRAEDARLQEQAIHSWAETRARTMALTDEQRAEMGLPIPSFTRANPALVGEMALNNAAMMQEATAARREADAAVEGKAPKVKQTWWLNALQTGARSLAKTGTSGLKYPVVLYEGVADFYNLGNDAGRSEPRVWLDTVDAALEKMLPGDKARSKDFVTMLSSGSGSMMAFLLAGFVGAAAGLPPGFAAGALGAASQGVAGFEEAESFGATGIQKYLSLMLSSAIGATEAIPIDRMFMRADTAAGGLIRRLLLNTRASSIEEFIQEASQSLGQDIVAKYLAGFDPDREIDVSDILKQGLVGALVGGASGGAVTLATEGGAGQPSAAEREAAANAVLSDALSVLDTIDGVEAGLPMPLMEQTRNGEPGPPDERPPVPAPLFMLEPGADGSVAVTPAPQQVQFKGGTPPVLNDQGLVDLTHYSAVPRTVLDPAKRGTGPLRGAERQRLGPPNSSDPDVVDRTYYGVAVGDRSMIPEWNAFSQQYDSENPVKKGQKRRHEDDKRSAYMSLFDWAGYANEGLGNYRHVVQVDPNDLYNWYEDPLQLWEKTVDPEYATLRMHQPTSARITRMERLIRDAGFRGAYFNRSEIGQTAILFDKVQPTEIIDERTGKPVEAGAQDVLAMTTEQVRAKLGEAVPGIARVAPYLTESERAQLRRDTAARLVDVFEKLPNADEMAAVAIAGSAKRGWYTRSAKALINIFGLRDAPRFAALLAALSPQTSVESNAVNALNMWVNWDKAGRPTDKAAINRLLGASVQGTKGADSVLPAWVPNTITALTAADPAQVELSGPKVSSFMRNLQGVTAEVTNDTWMANFANVSQALFKGTARGPEKKAGKGPGYIAMSAVTRSAAEVATQLTGNQWTPAEIQETVWSWTKALYEKASGAGETRSALQIVREQALTDAEIASTPDFATLFMGGVYRQILEKGGYDVDTEGSRGEDGGASGPEGDGPGGQGAAALASDLQPYLERAAARLDQLRAGQIERAPEIVDDIPFFDEPRKNPLSHLTDDDIAASDLLGMVSTDATDMSALPGLPKSSTGPIESVVRAARAYAASRGIPLRRQKRYVEVDKDRAARIAAEYDRMKDDPNDPQVAAAYQALVEETLAQFQFVKASGLQIEFIEQGQPDPYPEGPKQVLADLQRGHLWVFPTDQGFGTLNEAQQANPLLAPTSEVVDGRQLVANDVFRIVHDFFGHGLEGAGFGARGEENAWQAHMRLFSEAAIPAMTSETRGQNSWVNYGPHGEANRANQRETVYADQKTGLMPEWTWREGVEDDAEFAQAKADALGMFAGGQAYNAAEKRPMLDKAQNMASAGYSPEDIWNETGMYLGVDGGWRFEILDDDARLTTQASDIFTIDGRSYSLATARETIQHDKLYDAYPELKRMPVLLRRSPQKSGAYYPPYSGKPARIEVSAPNEEEAISVLLHEMQHAIQEIEGFASGGNTFMGELYEGPTVDQLRKELEEVKTRLFSDDARPGDGSLVSDLRRRLRDAAAYEYYRRIAGEVEARNVQKRHDFRVNVDEYIAGTDMTREEWMKQDIPSATEDVRRGDQIIVSRSRSGIGYQTQSVQDPNVLAANASPGTSAARTPYKAEPTRPSAGIPEAGAPTQEQNDASLARISREFIKLMGLTVRQGRFTLKGSRVMGQWMRSTAVARLREWGDLSTLVHEGGHALHDAIEKSPAGAAFIAKNQKPLMAVADKLYGRGIVDTALMPVDVHVREGFAELLRTYTLNRADAVRYFPALTAEFEQLITTENPKVKVGLDAIGQAFMAYLQLPSVQVMRNIVVPGQRGTGINAAIKELRSVGFRSWMREFGLRGITQSINRYAPLNRVVADLLNVGQRNANKAIDLKRADDPRVLIRLAGNASSRAIVQLTDGVFAYRGLEPTTKGLREAIMVSQGLDPKTTPRAFDENRLHDFDTFLVALRALDEYRRFWEGKISRPPIQLGLGDVMQTIEDLRTKYGDSFVNAATMVNDFSRALWQKQYDAGLMSKDTYEAGNDRQFYAPLQRDMSDKAGDFAPNAVTGGRSLVKKFKGSDRNIVSPLSVLMHKTFALEQTIAQNDAVKALAALADKAGTAGALVERIPASQIVGQMMSVEDVARQLTKDDTITEADASDLVTILAASIENGNYITMFRREQVSDKGENILFFWENGKVQAIQLKDGEVGRDVVNMMNGVGRETMNWGMELIAGTSTAFRSAITKWPDFLIVNFIRDQISAWILSDVGFKPFATGLRGVVDEVRQKQWARHANAAMMTMGGMNTAALHEARVNRDINSLRAKGYIARVFSEGGMKGAIKGLGRFTEVAETGTRLGLFRNAFERAKRDDLTDWEAAIEASYIATDYLDYGLNGNRMLAARRLVPFLNAQLQGYYKMLRVLGADEVRQRHGLKFALAAFFKSTKGMDLSRTEKHAIQTGRKAWLKMVSLGMLSALLHFIFEDDEDYQEAGEYLRVTGWVLPIGDGRVFYIPKPFELAMIANATERALESASGDPEAKNRFLRGALMTMVPPTSPPAVQVLIEYMANKDFFSGREIVPDYMQALAPELQYNNYTSSLAKWFGENLGWSPMVVDHFLSGLGASAYRDMVTMTDRLDPNKPAPDWTDEPISRRFIRDVRRGSAPARDFWAQASMTNGKLRRAEVTYRNYLEAGNQPAADRFLSTLSEDEQAYALLNTHFKAEAKRLNPMYRARQINTIVSGMRRELSSDLGLENTDKLAPGNIRLGKKLKADLDEVLSELARREQRNTLVATGAPGWVGKSYMDVEKTLDMLDSLSPIVRDELTRRMTKAKVYDAQTVFEGWPEARDRLLMDRGEAFLNDLVTIAKVTR